MLILEPAPTRQDIHFRLFGFPVRIHPLFWVASVLLGIPLTSQRLNDLATVWTATFVLVALVSILIHELGHAFAIRFFRCNSRIVLYHLGGLAITEPKETAPFAMEEEVGLRPRDKILISLAGPAAGFVLAGLVIGVLLACRIEFRFQWTAIGGPWWNLGNLRAQNEKLWILAEQLLFVNFIWGLVNLLPVYPLDGGQVARELLSLKNPRAGLEKSLILSIVVGAMVAVAAMTMLGFPYGLMPALMFAVLAFASYHILQQVRAMGGPGGAGYYGPETDDDDWWKK